jgi:hypothetical protein
VVTWCLLVENDAQGKFNELGGKSNGKCHGAVGCLGIGLGNSELCVLPNSIWAIASSFFRMNEYWYVWLKQGLDVLLRQAFLLGENK